MQDSVHSGLTPSIPTESGAGACCRRLLSEGLDLCVRARRLDSQQRTNDLVEHSPDIDLERFAARSAHTDPDRPYMTRSGTIALWVQDQYDHDVADWERRARHHLTQGCDPTPSTCGIANGDEPKTLRAKDSSQ